MTPRATHSDGICYSAFFNFFFEGLGQGFRSIGPAAGACANSQPRWFGIPLGDDLISKDFEICRFF
jgi:hypothetical protein